MPLDPPRLIALPDRPERTPLTSEPPLAEAAPLTSEPPLAAEPPLTSEAVYPEPEWHAETAHG
ncbi:hypothetical protein [Streptomyces sp. 7-21]|uniref:hypothetical protein n=1 Tax=Streptomyces sp. 7-21 TaxID=2802283 RepID=UPI00191F0BC7|nr:hypothetical protein [Streptomyces sp. 7-21]MBL1066496.1 hypothetical protein [Streptomyces sp. 7-21]